jgi:transcriptional regulator with XRE-family HTH domain
LQTERGFLKKDVAEAVGISSVAYYRYETGARKPDIDTLIRLCAYFNVSSDYLLGLSDESKPHSPDLQERAKMLLNEKREV